MSSILRRLKSCHRGSRAQQSPQSTSSRSSANMRRIHSAWRAQELSYIAQRWQCSIRRSTAGWCAIHQHIRSQTGPLTTVGAASIRTSSKLTKRHVRTYGSCSLVHSTSRPHVELTLVIRGISQYITLVSPLSMNDFEHD